MRRMFTYGCSYTKYYYPTWADILLKDRDGYNCGKIGSGNQLIANRIWETHAQKNFTKDDTIIIMWSNFFREDRYNKDGWQTKGNIFFWSDNIQIEELPHYVYRDCNLIASTLIGLEKTGAKIISTHINNPYEDELLLEDTTISNILDTYKQWVYPQTQTITDLCYYPGIEVDKTRPQYIQDNTWRIEDHPLPLEHLKFVQEELKYHVSNSTIQWATEEHKKLQEIKEYDRVFSSGKEIEWVI